ncbi:MAG: hypothetical protein WC030_03305 [Candidatus Paceibacterota bacterium]
MNTHKGFINPLWLVAVFVLIAGGGAAWWYTQIPRTSVTETPKEQLPVVKEEEKVPALVQQAPVKSISNIFTYQSKPGDKVGEMVLATINPVRYSLSDPNPSWVKATFTGTTTLIGRLSAPTGDPRDVGMGPDYSLNDLTPASLAKLPYFHDSERTVWFGFKNESVIKAASVKNGDMVRVVINEYDYSTKPAEVWNVATLVSIEKVQ